eukprot:3176428-Amphidinium_carterae.1
MISKLHDVGAALVALCCKAVRGEKLTLQNRASAAGSKFTACAKSARVSRVQTANSSPLDGQGGNVHSSAIAVPAQVGTVGIHTTGGSRQVFFLFRLQESCFDALSPHIGKCRAYCLGLVCTSSWGLVQVTVETCLGRRRRRRKEK